MSYTIATTTFRATHPDDTSIADTERRSLRVVATLEEARQHGYDAVGRTCSFSSPDWRRFRADFYALSESGGSVGPLPDGTMIEVVRDA